MPLDLDEGRLLADRSLQLKARNGQHVFIRVWLIIGAVDPYLNVDAGTMAPTEYAPPRDTVQSGAGLIRQRHGEVFVLDDGGEVDLDLGN